ncbi:MAG: hypothetical protein MUF64_00915 [Polyangiaceae bacterium]|nr:hypothetical protein [Polyangiaceae bacterium]
MRPLPSPLVALLALSSRAAFAQPPPPPPVEAPSSPSAEATAPTPAPPPPTSRLGTPRPPYRAPQWGVGARVGPRYVWARSPGLDPVASGDLLIGAHFEGLIRVWKDGPLSAWVVGGWLVGGAGTSSQTRGLSSSFSYQGLQVGAEARYELRRWLQLHGRLAPGLHTFRVALSSPELPYTLSDRSWTWSGDATAGASVLLGSIGNDEWPTARLWVAAEGGYTVTGAVDHALKVETDDEEEQRRIGSTRLPSLSGSGALLRVTFGLTF